MARMLKVFLCHSSVDKAAVRNLYHRLISGGVKPWLDEEDLLPGQDWQVEIPRAVRASDAVIVCLSRNAVNKAGYIQREIQYALDVAAEQPEGAIFLVPVRLEDCVVPDRLQRWHWVDIFQDRGYERLERALAARLASIIAGEAVSVHASEEGRKDAIGTPVASPSSAKTVASNIEARLKNVIVEQLGVDEDEVTLDASFVEDLGTDSLDVVELVMAVEEEFGIAVPDEIAERGLTVRDALEYLKANVSE